MVTIQDLLTNARILLGDSLSENDQPRFSDVRLIQASNTALNDVNKDLDLFKKDIAIALTHGLSIVNLNATVVRLLAASYDGLKLDIITTPELERRNKSWKKQTGSRPQAIVVNNQPTGEFRVYPEISIEDDNTSLLNIDGGDGFLDTITGFTPNVITSSGENGFLTDVTDFIELTVIARLPLYTTPTQTVDLVNTDLLLTLQHLIASLAYQNNDENQDLAKGAAEYAIYQRKISDFRRDENKSGTDTNYRTVYNPMGL